MYVFFLDHSDLPKTDDSDDSLAEESSESNDEEDDKDQERIRLAFDNDDDEVCIYQGCRVTMRGLSEVLAALQNSNNESDRGMGRIVEALKQILPSGHVVTNYQSLKKILLKSVPVVQRIHACWKDCVLFIGRHESRRRCPECQELRYYQTFTGHLKPVNVYRFIPIADQLRLFFANPVLAQDLRLHRPRSFSEDEKVNDITESEGFREKVWDSGFMSDSRNIVLLLSTDGVNRFNDTVLASIVCGHSCSPF